MRKIKERKRKKRKKERRCMLYKTRMFVNLFRFHGISSFVDYLIPNHFLYK